MHCDSIFLYLTFNMCVLMQIAYFNFPRVISHYMDEHL